MSKIKELEATIQALREVGNEYYLALRALEGIFDVSIEKKVYELDNPSEKIGSEIIYIGERHIDVVEPIIRQEILAHTSWDVTIHIPENIAHQRELAAKDEIIASLRAQLAK
jgi:hypothetical protein